MGVKDMAMPKQDFENHYTKWHKPNEEQNDTVCGLLAGSDSYTGQYFVYEGRWICSDCLEFSNTRLYSRLEQGVTLNAGELGQWLGGKAFLVPTLLSLINSRVATTAKRFADYRREQEGLNLAARVEELEKIVERLLNNVE